MLNHPWQAPPHPAGASRVQPLSLQFRPLLLWSFAFAGGRCVPAAARQPIAQSHCSPYSQSCFCCACMCYVRVYVDTPAFMPTCQPSHHQVEETSSVVCSPRLTSVSRMLRWAVAQRGDTLRATNNDNIKWVFNWFSKTQCADQSQCPVLTLGDSSTSQRQPSAHHLPGWWSHTLRAPSHQRDCYGTQTRKSGESASLCKIKLEPTKLFLFLHCSAVF